MRRHPREENRISQMIVTLDTDRHQPPETDGTVMEEQPPLGNRPPNSVLPPR